MKFGLLAGVSAPALIILSTPAHAQPVQPDVSVPATAAPVHDAPEGEAIVVTGFRGSNSASISDKRDAIGITDGINQDAIGMLPDLTISDIARRIPGVTTASESGVAATRSIGASEKIVIRGLAPNFNIATFDGAPIATASENDRAANLSLFPPAVASRIEAIKTIDATRDPHALSGQLNMVTASAFARNRPYTTMRLSVGQNSTSGDGIGGKKPSFRWTGLHTRQIGDDFGLVVSGSWEKFNATSLANRPGGEAGTYRFYSADGSNALVHSFDASNGMPAPGRNQYYLFEIERERASAVAKLEWQPSDATYASIFGGWFHENEIEARHEHLVSANTSRKPVDQTVDTGTWAQGRIETGLLYQPNKTTTSVVTGKLRHDVDDRLGFRATGSFSNAHVKATRLMSKFLTPYSAATGFSYDQSGGYPTFGFADPEAANDPNRQVGNYIRDLPQDIQQDLYYLDGAMTWNADRDDYGLGLEIGGAYTHTNHRFDREYLEGDVFNLAGCTNPDITKCPLVTLGDYMLDKTLGTNAPGISFYFIDDEKLRQDWIAQGQLATADRTANAVNTDYSLSEAVRAAYVQAVYRTDRLAVHAGLRFDSTRTNVDVPVRDLRLPSSPGSAQYVREKREYDYDFLLPSLIASYEVNDRLLLRGAYTRTIGRPNYTYIKRGESIGIPDDEDPADPTITITRGNPDLRPLVADNYDASVEYYFDGGNSLISLAGFYKDVADLIYVRNVIIDDYEFEGRRYTARLNQPMNATNSSIYGVEFQLRKDLSDILPAPLDGFIFNGNVTWIGSRFTYINEEGVERTPSGWLNQPELIVNAQLLYEKGPFGAKVGYAWVGGYLANILSENGDVYDVYAKPRGVIDLQARYRLSDNFTVVGEVSNLTAEKNSFERDFSSGRLLAGDSTTGRVVWLGVNMRF